MNRVRQPASAIRDRSHGGRAHLTGVNPSMSIRGRLKVPSTLIAGWPDLGRRLTGHRHDQDAELGLNSPGACANGLTMDAWFGR